MGMITIEEVRKKFPQYDHLSDIELTDKLYDKFYKDDPKAKEAGIDRNEFRNRVGYSTPEPKGINPQNQAVLDVLANGLGGTTREAPRPLAPHEQPMDIPLTTTKAPALPRGAPQGPQVVTPPASPGGLPAVDVTSGAPPRSPMAPQMSPTKDALPALPVGGNVPFPNLPASPAMPQMGQPGAAMPAETPAPGSMQSPVRPGQTSPMAPNPIMGGMSGGQMDQAQRLAAALGAQERAAAATTPEAPKEGAISDLKAGILQAKQIMPGIKAGGAARTLNTSTHDMAATGSLAAELQGVTASIQQLEAERATLTGRNRNPERAQQIDASIAQLRQRRGQLALLVGDQEQAAGMIASEENQAVGAAQDLSESVMKIRDLGRQMEKYPQNKAAAAIGQAETFGEGWEALKGDPLGAIRSFALRSLPSSVPTIGAAVAGSLVGSPLAGGIAAGGAGAATEYGASVAEKMDEALREAGIDPANPDAIRQYSEQNPQAFTEIMRRAAIRAGVIGAADAISAGLTGKIASSAANSGRATRVGTAIGTGALIDPVMEGAGEAAAMQLSDGKIEPGEVMAEALGGVGQGAAQTTGQVLGEAIRKTGPQQPKPPQQGEPPVTPTPDDPVSPAPAPQAPQAPETPSRSANGANYDEENTDDLDYIETEDGQMHEIVRDEDGKIKRYDPVREGDQDPVDVEARLDEMGVKQPKGALQKKPFTHTLKNLAFGRDGENVSGIDPNGPLGKELKARGVTPRTAPGLFRVGGTMDGDGIPVSEMRESYPDAPDDGNGYVPPQWIIDTLELEQGGKPKFPESQMDAVREHEAFDSLVRDIETGQDAPAEGAQDALPPSWVIPPRDSDISTGMERVETIRQSLKAAMDNGGLLPSDVDMAGLINSLDENGGDVDFALNASLKKVDLDAQYDDVLRAYNQGDNPRAPETQANDDIPFPTPGDQQGATTGTGPVGQGGMGGRPEDTQRPAGQPGTQGQGQGPRGAVRSDQEPSDGPEFESTSEGQQGVIPGFEQDEARSNEARKADQKRELDAKAKQSKMGTTTEQEDAGPLFDDQDELDAIGAKFQEKLGTKKPDKPKKTKEEIAADEERRARAEKEAEYRRSWDEVDARKAKEKSDAEAAEKKKKEAEREAKVLKIKEDMSDAFGDEYAETKDFDLLEKTHEAMAQNRAQVLKNLPDDYTPVGGELDAPVAGYGWNNVNYFNKKDIGKGPLERVDGPSYAAGSKNVTPDSMTEDMPSGVMLRFYKGAMIQNNGEIVTVRSSPNGGYGLFREVDWLGPETDQEINQYIEEKIKSAGIEGYDGLDDPAVAAPYIPNQEAPAKQDGKSGKKGKGKKGKGKGKKTQNAQKAKAKPIEDMGFSKDELSELGDIAAAFKKKTDGSQLNSGLDPDLIGLAYRAARIYIQRGVREFRQFAKAFTEQFGLQFDNVARYLRDAYNSVREDMEDDGEDVSDMDDSRAVRTQVKELQDELRDSGNDLEQDQEPTDDMGEGDVPNDGPGAGRGAGPDQAGNEDGRPVSDGGVPDTGTASTRAGGSTGDRGGVSRPAGSPTGSPVDQGSPASGVQGQPDAGPEQIVDAYEDAASKSDAKPDPDAQRAANQSDVKPRFADPDSIEEMLPALYPEQRDDVLKIEERFFAPKEGREKGYGYMNTNGTGTGKTFVAAGLIKRFVASGKGNVLIMTKRPTFATFKEALTILGVPYSVPKDTKSVSKGVNLITINGALGENKALANVDWDLIVPDESNYISENMQGEILGRGDDFRGLILHPKHLDKRANMVLDEELQELYSLQDQSEAAALAGQIEVADKLRDQANDLSRKIREKREKLIKQFKTKPRPHVAMFSATPFSTAKSLEYAEGLLFDYEDIKGTTGNQPDGRQKFMIQNFGFRMKYSKLTEPDVEVDVSMMARRFKERLTREGIMDGRVLEVESDYERMWVDVDGGVGSQIDKAFKIMFEDKKYKPLHQAFSNGFKHHMRIQLFEAIKAKGAIEYIQKDLDMGRKVVVFHDRQKGGGFNPFDTLKSAGKHQSQEGLEGLWADFKAENHWITQLDFSDLKPARDALLEAFPQAGIVGSGVTANKSAANQVMFNMDDSEMNVIITQSESGKDGWSGHDTTGKHQRAIHNLGIPNRPTGLIQQEGRIYRVGQASDAIFRYYNTGTLMEKRMFADVISGRADMAEALAMGDEARGLRSSIIRGFQASGPMKPRKGEGKGGKAADREARTMDPFQEAVALYMAQQRGRQNDRGEDYFATPEPLGLRMVEWADINAGERVLEPSAGHGAIARFFPSTAHQTTIEKYYDLQADLGLNAPDVDRTIAGSFEDLTVINKFHAIVMNPPFGRGAKRGGKLAMEHLKKAATHLFDGGRIVAIIPRGPMADKNFDSAAQDMELMGVYQTGNVNLPSVTFKRAGTAVSARVVIFDKQKTEDGKRYVQNMMEQSKDIEANTVEQLVDALRDQLPITGPRYLPPVDEAKEVEIPPIEEAAANVVELVEGQPIARPVKFSRDREVHNQRVDLAQSLGGAYVAKKKDPDKWGFNFPDEAAAKAFTDQLNGKARKAGMLREDFMAEKPRTMAELRARLDDLGLTDVDLKEIDGNPRDDLGRFRSRGGNMEILLRNTFGGADTLNHEAIHALKAMNLFSDKEWAALEAKAPEWVERYAIDERYPDADQATRNEEAIAEAFAEWVKKSGSGAGMIGRGFEKVRRFFAAMLSALRHSGMPEAADVFHGVDRGDVGTRERIGYAKAVDLARVTTGAYADPNPGMFRALKDVFSSSSDWWTTGRVLFQDAFIHWKKVDRSLGLTGEKSSYDKMSLVESKAGVALEQMERDYQEPIARLMGENELSMTAVGAFLMDRHADERDDKIAKLFGRTEGSGLTVADRAAITAELRKANADQMKALKEIGDLVDKMQSDAITMRVDAGLLSPEEAASWREYDHYVPLKGFEEVDGMTVSEQLGKMGTNRGQGNNVKGREAKAAKGRTEVGAAKMEDVIPHVMAGVTEAIVRAHKNEVGRRVLATVRSNPSRLWEEVKRKSRPVLNQHTGQIQWVREFSFKDTTDPAVISMKEGGKEVMIRLNDAALARAYSKMGFSNIAWVSQQFRHFTQFRSSTLTRWSPTFVMTNTVRDIATGLIISQKFKGPRYKKVRRRIAGYYLPALYASGKNAVNPDADKTEWDKWAREFKKEGGATAFAHYTDVRKSKDEVAKRAKHYSHGMMRRAAKHSMTAYFDVMRVANEATENAMRLSTYRALREAGIDKVEAANEAKTITVNFNRRGEWTSEISSYSMFFNPAVQGAFFIGENIKSLSVPVVGLVSLGIGMEIINRMMQGEEEEWDEMPLYEKQRNLIVPNIYSEDDTAYFKVPLPYNFSSFVTAGRVSTALFNGDIDVAEAWKDIASEVATSWSPTGPMSWGTFVPDAVDPIAEVIANKNNFFGSKVHYGRVDNGAPLSAQVSPSQSWASGLIAEKLNSWTGGTENRSGSLDLHPKQIDHLIFGYTGSLGRMVAGIAKEVSAANAGVDVRSGSEIGSVFYGSKDDRADISRSYDNSSHVTDVTKEAWVMAANYAARRAAEVGVIKDQKAAAKSLVPQLMKDPEFAAFVKDNRKALSMSFGTGEDASKRLAAAIRAGFKHELEGTEYWINIYNSEFKGSVMRKYLNQNSSISKDRRLARKLEGEEFWKEWKRLDAEQARVARVFNSMMR